MHLSSNNIWETYVLVVKCNIPPVFLQCFLNSHLKLTLFVLLEFILNLQIYIWKVNLIKSSIT